MHVYCGKNLVGKYTGNISKNGSDRIEVNRIGSRTDIPTLLGSSYTSFEVSILYFRIAKIHRRLDDRDMFRTQSLLLETMSNYGMNPVYTENHRDMERDEMILTETVIKLSVLEYETFFDLDEFEPYDE